MLRQIRGPFWYVSNILVACWRFNLRDMSERPGVTPLKRAAYRTVMTIETLLEAVFLAAVVLTTAATLLVFLPARWAFLEIRDTWSPG